MSWSPLSILALYLVLPLGAPALAQAPAPPPATSTAASDWPQWRGTGRDGVSRETGLLKEWPKGGPKLLWTVDGAGGGFSSFAVAGGRLYTQGDTEDSSHVIAFDVAAGKKLWNVPNGPLYPNSRGSGPRGTPTLDGGMLYALSGNGKLICVDAEKGESRWSLDILKEFQGENPHWGLSESPLIEKDLVLATPGGKIATVVALDKRTGKTVWKMLQARDRAAYSSLVAADLAGVRQVIAFTSRGAMGMAASDGTFLWRYDKANNTVANVATPIVRGDLVFVSSDYGVGGALLKLVAQGKGVEAKEVYFTKRMQNHHASSILVGDHLYGSSDKTGSFTCLEFLTGKVMYPAEGDRRSPSIQKSGMVYADGHFYCLGEDGEMALVEANPKGLVVKSRFQAFEKKPEPWAKDGRPRRTWAHPVVAGGRLYLRNQDQIFCYALKT